MTSLLDTCDSVVNNERRRALALAPGVGNGATGVYDDDANADAKLTAEAEDDDDDFNAAGALYYELLKRGRLTHGARIGFWFQPLTR